MSEWEKLLSEEDMKNVAAMRACMAEGLPLKPMPPPVTELDPSVPHAPRCPLILSPDDARTALANALRYFPEELHAELAPEFAEELRRYGHIYMYRFRPVGWEMKAYPFQCYPARTTAGKALQLMICNNLDRRVAQFPHELVTYGGTGHVFQNWAQFRLAVKYINEMTDEQTIPMYSGHPAGLYPSPKSAPRVIITNGMVIPHYSDGETFERLRAMGCTMYGQMTAGSYCYIGPQGIVHGTTLTLLNAGRRYLDGCEDLHGKVYVTSGLGGMSGAQGKASRIVGAIGVIAEVSRAAIDKRKAQGWVDEVFEEDQLEALIARVKEARATKESVAIAWHGNVVALWERLVAETSFTPELGSDQTSLHNPYFGGYYPVQISFDEANAMMADEPEKFRALVDESLRRQVAAINALAARGLNGRFARLYMAALILPRGARAMARQQELAVHARKHDDESVIGKRTQRVYAGGRCHVYQRSFPCSGRKENRLNDCTFSHSPLCVSRQCVGFCRNASATSRARPTFGGHEPVTPRLNKQTFLWFFLFFRKERTVPLRYASGSKTIVSTPAIASSIKASTSRAASAASTLSRRG